VLALSKIDLEEMENLSFFYILCKKLLIMDVPNSGGVARFFNKILAKTF
jgi:hypothetical protein